MPLESINPATGERIAAYEYMTDSEVHGILKDAAAGQKRWAAARFEERARCLGAAARILQERSSEWARLMAVEMGKPVSAGKGEANKCALGCDFYAEHSEAFLRDEPAEGVPASRAFVRYQPIGTILAVMPWNFPFWQLFRAAAPALMAGNAMVLKHSSNVTGCALAIEQIIHDAGVPRELFRTLRIDAKAAQALVDHPLIAGVTLTGSEAAGRSIGAAAGHALKPSVLELGGSDPFIVLEDADVERTAKEAATARCQNSGQSCIAAKRFLVLDAVYDRFVPKFVEAMAVLKVGDPLDESTDVGPQARTELRDELHGQVERSVAAGAKVLLGAEKPAGAGAWYPPTVLTDVAPGMPAYDEEVFGPVAAVIRVRDAEEAIAVANGTCFGLGASVWTENVAAAARFIDELESGLVFVNDYVRSDPRLPFGGVKNSGYGRELSVHGIREWVNAKTVWIH